MGIQDFYNSDWDCLCVWCFKTLLDDDTTTQIGYDHFTRRYFLPVTKGKTRHAYNIHVVCIEKIKEEKRYGLTG